MIELRLMNNITLIHDLCTTCIQHQCFNIEMFTNISIHVFRLFTLLWVDHLLGFVVSLAIFLSLPYLASHLSVKHNLKHVDSKGPAMSTPTSLRTFGTYHTCGIGKTDICSVTNIFVQKLFYFYFSGFFFLVENIIFFSMELER